MSQLRDHKCVIILQSGLPFGFAANAAPVLAISVGQRSPEIVAENLVDGSGVEHAGLVNVPVPVLQASTESLKKIRDQAVSAEGISLVDFSEPARVARTFEDYKDLLGKTKNEDLQYVGLAILGNKKIVSQLTAGLALLK